MKLRSFLNTLALTTILATASTIGLPNQKPEAAQAGKFDLPKIKVPKIELPTRPKISDYMPSSNYTIIGEWGNSRVYAEKSFSGSKQQALGHIFSLLQGLLYVYANEMPEVRKCISMNSSENNVLDKLQIFDENSRNPMISKKRTSKFILINREYTNTNKLGQASVGIAVNNGDYEITLNARHFGSLPSEASTNQWTDEGRKTQELFAGVVFHEMLHNLGYEHRPDVDTKNNNVAGNFVYEAGWCVARRGAKKIPGNFGLAGNRSTDFYVD
jgi:hypothetical protein